MEKNKKTVGFFNIFCFAQKQRIWEDRRGMWKMEWKLGYQKSNKKWNSDSKYDFEFLLNSEYLVPDGFE